MNYKEMYTSINKGIPNYIPITLDIKTVIKECSDDMEESIRSFKKIGDEHQKMIANIVSMTKAQRFFFKKLQVWTNRRTSETNLFVLSDTLLEQLQIILNIKTPYQTREQLLNLLNEKVTRLFYIKRSEELQKEFPLIYEDYLLSIKSAQQIHNLTSLKSSEVINEQWKYYNMYGLSTNFNQFMNRQRVMYSNLVSKSRKIEIETNTHPIDLNCFKGLNKAKFELYLAHKYLEYALNTTNIQEKQECVYYLCTYIRETKYTPISIIDENGTTITFDKITKGYRRLFKKNIELKPIDADREKFEGFHMCHVKNHVRKHYMNAINWQIVPKGHDTNKIHEAVINCLNRTYRHLTPEERKKIIDEAYALYERKLNFFESTDYIEKVYGIGKFNGYMAYFYANGEVLMEKFFDDYAESLPAKNEAIYNLKVVDFEALSKLSKPKLMKNEKCRRIIHSGKWEDKAKEIIDTEATEESMENVQKVLTKIKSHT